VQTSLNQHLGSLSSEISGE